MVKKLLILALLVGWVNVFFYSWWGVVNFFLATLVFLAWVVIATYRGNWQKYWWLGVAVLVLFTGAMVRQNEYSTVLAWLGMVVVTVVWVYLQVVGLSMLRNLVELGLVPLRLAANYILSGIQFTFKLIEWKPKGRLPENWMRTVVVGMVFGLTGVVLIGFFLVNGDLVFNSVVSDLFKFKISDELQGRVLFSIGAVILAIPILLLKLKKDFVSPLGLWQKVVLEKEAMIGVGMVAVLLAVFLLVQWPYIFVNVPTETSLVKFGVATYSEYVRKGFFELVIAAGLGYVVAALAHASMGKGKGLKVVQLILLSELGLFAFSILRRVWLYQSLHGWSLVRIYGALLVIWMMTLFVTLGLRQIRKWRFVAIEVGIAIVFLTFGVWFNVEQFIAQNHPPTVNGRVDYVYLSNMSGDGVDGWVMAYKHAKGFLSDELLAKPVVNSEDRRELSYAYLVVNNLTNNYHKLITKFGDKSKYLSYYDAVSRTQSELRTEWVKLPEAIKSQQSTNPYEDINKPCFGSFAWVFDHEFASQRPVSFYASWCSDGDDSQIQHPGGKLVYEKLDREVGFTRIHELQIRVAKMYFKVYLQPENEREVVLDRAL